MPLTLPNLVTLLRILLIPLIVGIFYVPDTWLSDEGKNISATGVFVVAAITDWLDGYLARRLNQMSAFGAFLDPVADKLVVVGALIVLLKLGRVDMVVGLIIIGREIAIPRCASGWRKWGRPKALPLPMSASSRRYCRWWQSRFCFSRTGSSA